MVAQSALFAPWPRAKYRSCPAKIFRLKKSPYINPWGFTNLLPPWTSSPQISRNWHQHYPRIYMNPVARPPRREWATYRETAKPTTRIGLAVGADDTTHTHLTDNHTVFSWNTFTCSICLRPTYIPIDQINAAIAATNTAHPETNSLPTLTSDEVSWLSDVLVLKHCPTFGHNLERIYPGRFTGPTTFEPARGGAETPPLRPAGGPGGRGNNPNKITAYKVTVHRECYGRLIRDLRRLAGDTQVPISLVRRLEKLRREGGGGGSSPDEEDEEMDEADTKVAAAMAKGLGLLLKERAERMESSGVHVLQCDLTPQFKPPYSSVVPAVPSPDPRPLSLGTASVLPPELINEIAALLLGERGMGATDFANLRFASAAWMQFEYSQSVWRSACKERFSWVEWEEWIERGLVPVDERGNVDWRSMYTACVEAPGMRGAKRIAEEVECVVKWVKRTAQQ